MLRRLLSIGLATPLLALSALFWLAFYDRYWIWRDCFNELGRCWDPDGQQVLLEQSGIIWGGLGGLTLLAGVVVVVVGWRR